MKALSIKQPGANLIASGRKTVEVRSWATRHRGPVLVVSSLRPNVPPAGCAVAVADLVDCRLMTEDDAEAACSPALPGAYAWVLEHIRPLQPFPVAGRLGLYEVVIDDALLRPLDHHGNAHAPADAQGGQAKVGVSPLHLVQQRDQDPGAGCADRVTERDGATIDIDDRRIEAYLPEHRQ